MKRYIQKLFKTICLLFAVSVFVGCSDYREVVSSESLTVKAIHGIESRTALGDDFKTVTWCDDEVIYLFGDGANAEMRIVKGAGTQVGYFTGTVNGFPYKLEKALYPVPDISGDEYSFQLENEMNYSENSSAPMYGQYDSGTVQFGNLVAMMRIPLSAFGTDRVLKLEMEGIAGKLIVDVENGTAEMAQGATNVVIVNVPAGDACFIDIPVPAKTYDNGYKVYLDNVLLAEKTGPVDMENVDKVEVVLNAPSTPDSESGVTADYIIATSADLLWVAKQVNTGADDFSGQTLVMTEDINLNGIAWTPIGPNADSENKFKGIFDGGNNTISNLHVETETGYTAAGLFGALNGTVKNLVINGASIKHISEGDPTENGIAVVAGSIYNTGSIENVTVKNAVVEGNRYVGAIAGYTYGSVTGCVVENVKLTATPDNLSGKYNNGDKVGGIVGYFPKNGNNVVMDNEISNVTIKGYRDLGGIAGYATGTVTNNSVEELTIIINTEHDYKNYVQDTKDDCDAAPIIGDGSAADASNTANDITYHVSSVLGLTTATNHAPTNVACEIVVAEGSYPTVIKVTGGKDLVYNVEEGKEVILGGVDHQSNGTPSTVVFNNLTIDNSIQSAGWFIGTSPNINPCVGAWGGYLTFNNCDFIVSGESKKETGVMTWWTGESLMKLNFYGCAFNGKADHPSARAMQIYGNVDMIVEDCVFKTYKDYTLKYVGNEGNSATFNNNKVYNSENFVELGSSAYPGQNYTVNINGSTLYQGVNSHIIANVEGQTVNINNKKVYPLD